MPEKSLDIWYALWNALPDPVKGALVGTVVALIRVMYDDREPRLLRRLLESTLCGAIAFAVASGAEALGLHGGYSTFAGGAVGLLGADQVRAWAQIWGRKRIEQSTGGPQ
jgi:lambda family phage holin